jgi:hypothetical protein
LILEIPHRAYDPVMRTFTCLYSDDRYSIPTLAFLIVGDLERARELARRELDANPHHDAFELHEGERFVCAEHR